MSNPKQNPSENTPAENNEQAMNYDDNYANESDENDLVQELEEAQQQLTEFKDKMTRMQAEMENLRKRAERDLSNAHKFGIERFAGELLQVKDSLELGLDVEDLNAAKLQEGTELTLKMLTNVLSKFAVEVFDPRGEVFDPNMHEAMTMQESSEHPPNTVIAVMQKGYTLNDRLLRPAMVVVSKAPSES